MATNETSGMSRPSRNRLMPTSTSNAHQAQIANDLRPLDSPDIRMQVAHTLAVLLQVVRQVLGHALGQSGDQDALIPGHALGNLGKHVVHLRLGRPDSIAGSTSPVGRTSCSTVLSVCSCS